jgi:hypothetical protein
LGLAGPYRRLGLLEFALAHRARLKTAFSIDRLADVVLDVGPRASSASTCSWPTVACWRAESISKRTTPAATVDRTAPQSA